MTMLNIYETIMKPENKDFIKSLFDIDFETGTLGIDSSKYHDEIKNYPGLELPMVTINANNISDEMGFPLSARTEIGKGDYYTYLERIKLFDDTMHLTLDNVMTALTSNSKIPVNLVFLVDYDNNILHNPDTGDVCKIVPIEVDIDTVNNNAKILNALSILKALPKKEDSDAWRVGTRNKVISNPNDFVESVFWYNPHEIRLKRRDEADEIIQSEEFKGWEFISVEQYLEKFKDDINFVRELAIRDL